MSTTDTTADQAADVVIGGPHPDLDALLLGEPEGSHVLDLFAPADEYQRAQFAVARPGRAVLEPDAVLDPPRLIAQARLISTTPTGSLALGAAVVARTMTMAEAMAWHDLRDPAYRSLMMGQDA